MKKNICGKIAVLSLLIGFYISSIASAGATVTPPPCDPATNPTCEPPPSADTRDAIHVRAGNPGLNRLLDEGFIPPGLDQAPPNDHYAGGERHNR